MRAANVRRFGAAGDGLADDTAAIQAAIDACGGAYLPAGVYRCGPLALPSGAVLAGDGPASVLLARPELGGHLLSPRNAAQTTVRGVAVRRLRLLGNSALQRGGRPMAGLGDAWHGIAVLGGEAWHIAEVWAEDWDGDGIYLGRPALASAPGPARGNRVERCVLRGNLRNGLMISDGTGNTVRGCVFEANQVGVQPGHPKYSEAYRSAQLDLEPNLTSQTVADNEICDCEIRGSYGHGVQLTRPGPAVARNRLRRCRFIDNRGVQVYLISPSVSGTVVEDCLFRASDPARVRCHLRVAMAADTRVLHCRFVGGTSGESSSRGVQLDDAGSGHGPLRTLLADCELDLAGGLGEGGVLSVGVTAQGTVLLANRLSAATVLDLRAPGAAVVPAGV
jgi:hypothetical protein